MENSISEKDKSTSEEFFVHPTSVIDEGAVIGSGSRIWHFSHIMPGARLGEKCIIGQNCYIDKDVQIGNRVKIQNNVSVYNGVTLHDGVFCGPSMVFTNVINPRAEIERKDEFKPTIVGCGATLGANCTIICGNDIGTYAMIAAGTVVTREVLPYSLIIGVPGRHAGWVCKCGVRLEDSEKFGLKICSSCNERYILNEKGIKPETEVED